MLHTIVCSTLTVIDWDAEIRIGTEFWFLCMWRPFSLLTSDRNTGWFCSSWAGRIILQLTLCSFSELSCSFAVTLDLVLQSLVLWEVVYKTGVRNINLNTNTNQENSCTWAFGIDFRDYRSRIDTSFHWTTVVRIAEDVIVHKFALSVRHKSKLFQSDILKYMLSPFCVHQYSRRYHLQDLSEFSTS